MHGDTRSFIVVRVKSAETIVNGTDEAGSAGHNKGCVSLQLSSRKSKRSIHFLFGGFLNAKQKFPVFLSPIPAHRNLTHLLGQQVNILFVASLRGVVELYQGQRLVRNTSEGYVCSASNESRTGEDPPVPEWWR